MERRIIEGSLGSGAANAEHRRCRSAAHAKRLQRRSRACW